MSRVSHAASGFALGILLAGVVQAGQVWAGPQQAFRSQDKRRVAGKQAASAGVAARESKDSAADSDFRVRCSAPGVIKCVGFDSTSDIAGAYKDNSGILSALTTPTLDTTMKASGNSSVRFTIPAHSVGGDAGAYFTNFSKNLSVQFDSGQEFYIQWRQRFSPEFINPGAGWKQAIITEGDRPGVVVSSCQAIGLIVQNTYQREFPQMYHSCGVKDGQYEPLNEPVGSPPTNFLLQNGIRDPGCLYRLVNSGRPYVPPCVGYKPNQWMTFQVHIKVGTWYRNNRVYKHDSIIQLWVAEEGKPSVLVIDYSPKDPGCQQQQVSQPACQTGYDLVNDNIGVAKYGKIWLLPYSGSSVFASPAYTWYDELIISRQRIPDPK